MDDETRKAVSGYAAEVANAWDRDGRRLMELAKRMGVTTGFVSQLRQHQSGVGLKGVVGLARTLGASVEELERRALAWHAAGRPPLGPEALTGAQGGAK
jgi:hypothetical protein